METKKILITGGSGFLGGHLVRQASQSWKVTATYWKHPFHMEEVNWIGLNLVDRNSVASALKEIQPQVVIHTAALRDLDYCEENNEEAQAINVIATETLAQVSEAHGARLIYLSTDMVFDGNKGGYSESDSPNPINYYGETKLLGEEKVAHICSDFVIARSALIYGEPQTGGSSFSHWILKRLKQGQEVPLYYDQYRTPILVQNLAQALLELAESDFMGILHLGGSQKINRYEFGVKLAHIMGFSTANLKKCSMNDVHSLAPRPKDVVYDITKAKTLLKTRLLSCDEGLILIKGRKK